MTARDVLTPPSPRIAKVFDGLSQGTIAEAVRGLGRLDSTPSHPYLARRLTQLLLNPPFRSTAAQALYTTAVCQLYRHGDGLTLRELEPYVSRYQVLIGDTEMGRWMGALVDELVKLIGSKLERQERDQRWYEAATHPELEEALETLRQGRTREVLATLLSAFSATRGEEVGAIIEALDGRERSSQRIFKQLSTSSARRVNRGLSYIVDWSPDPRIGAAVVEALARYPWSLKGVTALRFVAAVEIHGDSRRIEALRQAARDRRDVAHALAALNDRLALRRPLSKNDQQMFEDLGELTFRWSGDERADRALGEEMLEAIFRAPDDLEPRLIYADWLQERGDPRGELIALQCAGPGGSRDRGGKGGGRRIAELIDEYGETWLGPLRQIVLKRGLRFEAGFPAAVSIRDCSREVYEPLVGERSWSTISEVDFGQGGHQSGMDHPVMRSLRAVGGMTGRHFLALAARGSSKLERIGVQLGLEDESRWRSSATHCSTSRGSVSSSFRSEVATTGSCPCCSEGPLATSSGCGSAIAISRSPISSMTSNITSLSSRRWCWRRPTRSRHSERIASVG